MKKSKVWMMAAVWLTSLTAGHAQEAETFSIATLNVDGLPQKILVAKVNPDGPAAVAASGSDATCRSEATTW